MREFSSIDTRFWIDPEMQALSVESRLIGLYVVAGPHTTMLGCFRLPKSYVAEDLRVGMEVVSKGFEALSQLGFLSFDEKSGWLVIPDFFKWNRIHNPKHGQAIEKLFNQVPNGVVRDKLVRILQSQRYLSESFRKSIVGVSRLG